MRLSGRAIGLLILGGLCLMMAPRVEVLLWVGLGIDALLAVALVTDYLLLQRAREITGRREHDDILSMGVSNIIRIVVENPLAAVFHVALRDVPPDASENTDPSMSSGKLPAFGSFSFSYHLLPRARGAHNFGALTARVKTPIGLWMRQLTLLHDGMVKVYPNLRDTRQPQLLARRLRASALGLRAMRLRGQGMEFESLRDYMPDDELRHVDWKASARRGSMVTREYDVERSQQLMIVLDLGRAMSTHLDDLTKLDHAINATVLLTHAAAHSSDRVGIMAFAEEVVAYMPPGKGGSQLSRVLEQLYPLQPRPVESDYRRCFAYLANRLRKRSLVIIFTDLIDPDSSKRLVDNISLLHPQHLVLCVALSDYELVDILSGAPASETGLYQQTMATAVMEDRQLALAQLHQRGILTLDAAPSDLSLTVVNRYLQIKKEGRV
ncbi:MAG: DUF58 domain-containing protein [bacterium]